MFGPSRLFPPFLLLLAVTTIQPVNAFVSRSRIALQEASFKDQHWSKTRRTVPSTACHGTADSFAPTLWQRLSLQSWKRVIRKRAILFLLVLHLVLGLWRPPTARAMDEIANSSMATIEIDRSTEDRVVIQPLEIPSKNKIKLKTKSLVIAVGASGATFTAVRHKKRHDRDRCDRTETKSDPEEQKKKNDSNLANKEPFVQRSNPFASFSSLLVEQTSATGTEQSLEDNDNPNDSDSTTDTNSLVIDENVATTSATTTILQSDDEAKIELHDVVSNTEELKFQQEEVHINAGYPSLDPKFVGSRQQPKSKDEEERLKSKYGQIHDLSERAYQILVDLGMVDASNPLN